MSAPVLRRLRSLPLVLFLVLPLLAAVFFVLPGFVQAQGYADLLAHPQFAGAVTLTLLTGVTSTLLALLFALIIVGGMQGNGSVRAGAFIAVPHLALAMGLSFLMMPAGFVARLLAVFTGWQVPPQWVSTQDPWGITLIVALVLKETPFLVWVLASLLNREDVRSQLAGQESVARSLGHGPSSTFLRVVMPQLLPRAAMPLVAVFAYGMTVVDMALVTGPTQPPVLAQLVWTDLNDADPAAGARAAAGVLVLCALIAAGLGLAAVVLRASRAPLRRWWSAHPRTGTGWLAVSPSLWRFWTVVYAAAGSVLLVQSLSALWPFPDLLPHIWTVKAWRQMFAGPAPFLTSLILATVTATVSLVAALAWFESRPARDDRIVLAAATASLCLPSVLIALGQYRLFLWLGITGTGSALFLAHLLPVMAYVVLMLQGPYRSFDSRWQSTAAGLQTSRWRFLTAIKWPLLRPPLLAAFATGFAVSIAQFVPAQLAAAGRYATLPMEAVTLSAGGNRALIATSGLALMLLPLLVFAITGAMARPRWSR